MTNSMLYRMYGLIELKSRVTISTCAPAGEHFCNADTGVDAFLVENHEPSRSVARPAPGRLLAYTRSPGPPGGGRRESALAGAGSYRPPVAMMTASGCSASAIAAVASTPVRRSTFKSTSRAANQSVEVCMTSRQGKPAHSAYWPPIVWRRSSSVAAGGRAAPRPGLPPGRPGPAPTTTTLAGRWHRTANARSSAARVRWRD